MRYVMSGRVHPERADVSFSPQTWERASGESVTVSCESSQIAVHANLVGVDDHVDAFIVADQVVQAVVSAFGFALGTGYAVELVQVVEERGTAHVFGVRPGNLGFAPWPHEGVAMDITRFLIRYGQRGESLYVLTSRARPRSQAQLR
jgi:hypothetical protein